MFQCAVCSSALQNRAVLQFLGLLTLNVFEGLISSSEKTEKKPKLRAHRQKRRKLFSTLVRNQANPIF
jgi:hypothetical protein